MPVTVCEFKDLIMNQLCIGVFLILIYYFTYLSETNVKLRALNPSEYVQEVISSVLSGAIRMSL